LESKESFNCLANLKSLVYAFLNFFSMSSLNSLSSDSILSRLSR